ncbi:hybrid sensor histidine kinase/response regulator [Halomonas sp. GD1P12]|uniref:hybrid sensor histidine kinase/response regulator n=1 Tax=Halomonas sp. GD1P12 TaxID=2982691 RepID=UPI0021E3C667|nr:hybrid sensor histidine kinase/response regulator [Halomonas sp. GD1P12]UYG00360.1 hybrid sensor histidine kinase/response regulator [Halomonas sp. GD1P12]
MAFDLSRFIARFVEEAQDHLPRLKEGVDALGRGERHAEEINALFRAMHTLKGSSRMLRLDAITSLAHSAEELLSALRDGTRKPTPDTLELLNQAVELLDTQVNRLAEGHAPDTLPTADPALCQAMEGTTAAPASASDPAPIPAPVPGPTSAAEKNVAQAATDEALSRRLKLSDTVRVRLERLDDLIRLMGEVLSGHHQQHDLLDRAQALGKALPSTYQSTFRAFHRDLKDSVLTQDALMSDLHDRALQMRMLPLSVVFDPLAQMTRDLAHALNKQASCELQGSEIELDRQMIDRLSEPLIHLLRNALDHGLETPDLRRQVGKAAKGRVSLKAWQDGGWVVIELSDDGAGIDIDAVRQKALGRQLINEEQLTTLSEHETLELIFLPGFSTKPLITDMSGRGVGMDVVKRTVVDELSGDIRVDSQPGKGTTFALRLPLSLAMLRVLLIRAGSQTLGFTAPYVQELLKVTPYDFIDTAGQPTLVLRDEFIPVVSLASLLGLEAPAENAQVLLLIVHQGSQKLALIVEELIDERDMVIKPLPPHLRHLPLVAGMVSVGRNDLASLLHVPALLTQVKRGGRRSSILELKQARAHRILVVDDSLNTREIEKDVLEAWGYRVSLAENGRDGLTKALADSFDAVLTDVEMPIMDGFTLTARLREHERYQHVPIIIITSREKESDRQRGIDAGADAYIVKGSFDQNNLVDTLKALLG